MEARSYFGFHPQSFRASRSSMEAGQLSAMACRKSGLYVMENSGMCFFNSPAISFGEKLIPAILYDERILTLSAEAFMILIVASNASGIYIIGNIDSLFRKHS